MIDVLIQRQPEIAELCRQNQIEKLWVFGSAATGAYRSGESDMDFMIDLGDYGSGVARRYFDFADAMEALLNTKADFLTTESIRNPILRKSVMRDRKLLYERTRSDQVA